MRFSIILAFLILISCEAEKQEAAETNTDPRDSSTILMARELAEWYDRLTPDKSNYKSMERVKMFRKLANETQGIESLTFRLRSEYQLLLAGESRKAYEGFQQVDSIARAMGIPEDQNVYKLTDGFRAIAMLRLGEQENCLHNHSIESCIMPFGEASYHKMTEGSEGAIKEIQKILSYSDDLNYRYVLNVAYMTLGRYPEDVPPQWLLPMTFEEEKNLLPQGKFKNISGMVGIDDNRLSGGVVIEDFDLDNDLDIMTSSWKLPDQVFYYENDGRGNFTNKFREAGIEGIGGGLNMTHGDYNNDGYMDVFITRGAWLPYGTFPNSLLRNNGDGTFTDVTREAGVYSLHPTQASLWADFNNDGWLDIYVGNESYPESPGRCELWLNDGTGHFKDVAMDVGAAVSAFIKGVCASDYDNDGDIDIYLSNMSKMAGDNILLQNNKANNAYGFSFVNVADQAGVLQPQQSFPCWFFDMNNDGWDDIFNSAFPYSAYGQFAAELAKELMGQENNVEKPKIYLNNKNGTFTDVTESYGLNTTCYTMGSGFGDINNDGFLDFYLATGEPDFKALVPNRMFLNREGKRFSEVTSQGGFGHVQKGHAVSFADLNNDGHEDVYTVLGGAYEGDVYFNAFFLNPGTDSKWIKVDLLGTESNRPAFGAKVELVLSGPKGKRSVFRTVSSGSSFGENPKWIHLGFPADEQIEQLIVRWPQGSTQIFNNLETSKMYRITEGQAIVQTVPLHSYQFDLDKEHAHHHH